MTKSTKTIFFFLLSHYLIEFSIIFKVSSMPFFVSDEVATNSSFSAKPNLEIIAFLFKVLYN